MVRNANVHRTGILTRLTRPVAYNRPVVSFLATGLGR
jgi:hypothetical protein